VEALRQVRCLDLRDALRSPGCNELAADALAVLALAGRHLALPTPPALLRALGALLEPGAAPPRWPRPPRRPPRAAPWRLAPVHAPRDSLHSGAVRPDFLRRF